MLAVRYLLALKLSDPIPPVSLRLGTTRGTTALLTRRGARAAFVTTRGFADVLRIGYQNRPPFVVAAPNAAAELPFTIDEAMTLPISEENLIAALRSEGFAITGPRPERSDNVSTVGMTAAAISFKTTAGRLRGVIAAAGRNGDAATAEQNAKLLAAVSALAMDGSRDEARAAVAASTATAFGKGGDDPARVISYSNSKATVRVRPVPDGGLLVTITPNPERLLQVR